MYQYPKPYLSVEQLVQKLIDAGMEISSQDEAEKFLNTIGYYRLKGYCYHRFDNHTNQYIADTKLCDVIELYNFDTKLSHLIFWIHFANRGSIACESCKRFSALSRFGRIE